MGKKGVGASSILCALGNCASHAFFLGKKISLAKMVYHWWTSGLSMPNFYFHLFKENVVTLLWQ